MTAAEISKMSLIERLQTMEELWDSLTHDRAELESPQWHQQELSDRREKIEKGEAVFTSFETLKAKYKK